MAKEIAPLERNLHNGKKRIVRTLGTPHKIEALRRRTAVLAEIEVQLERARRGKHGVAATGPSFRAKRWRTVGGWNRSAMRNGRSSALRI